LPSKVHKSAFYHFRPRQNRMSHFYYHRLMIKIQISLQFAH